AYAGIGFAIPVDLVNQVVPQLMRNRRVERPTLPVKVADDAIARRRLGIRSGVLILDVTMPEAARVLQPTRRDRSGRIILVDFIEELRLRRWARENFVPADLRQATWHPVILEEMTRKERDIRSSDAGRLLVTQA